MSCPQSPGCRQPMTDAQWQAHLAQCPACRQDDVRQQRLGAVLAALPLISPPTSVCLRMEALQTEVGERRFGCMDMVPLLDAWCDDTLDAPTRFLMEEHLLACAACAMAVAQTACLTAHLSQLALPAVPATVAERITRARMPWWRRWQPVALPQWAAGAVAVAGVAVVLMGIVLLRPPTSPSTGTLVRVPPPSVVAPMASVAPKRHGDEHPVAAAPVIALCPDRTTATPGTAAARASHRRIVRRVTHPTLQMAASAMAETLSPSAASAPRVEPLGHPTPAHIASRTVSVPSPVAADAHPAVSTVREAMLRLAREAELARAEEALSEMPDAVVVAMAPHGMAETRTTGVPASTAPAVDAGAMRQALNGRLVRERECLPAPISVRSQSIERQNEAIIFTLQ